MLEVNGSIQLYMQLAGRLFCCVKNGWRWHSWWWHFLAGHFGFKATNSYVTKFKIHFCRSKIHKVRATSPNTIWLWANVFWVQIPIVVSPCSVSHTTRSASVILQATTRKCPLCPFQAYGCMSSLFLALFTMFEYAFWQYYCWSSNFYEK